MVVLAGISGLHLIVCGALMRPLSSPLNWKSRHGKLRLLEHRSAGIIDFSLENHVTLIGENNEEMSGEI